MRYLKVKEVQLEKDLRESNILDKDIEGNPINFKQSEYTCRVILKDKDNEEFSWVIDNETISKVIETICKNEEYKYHVPEKEVILYPSGSFIMGRYLFFLSWIFPHFDKYLIKHGFNPPTTHLNRAEKEKHGKFEKKV